MKKYSSIHWGVALIFLLGVCIGFIEGATIVVPDNYGTIQEAVRAASNGDTIFVRAGIYNEAMIHVGGFSSLAIIGEEGTNKIRLVKIDSGDSYACFQVYADGVTIEGFEITNCHDGIRFKGSYNKFKNNYIHHTHIGISANMNEGEGYSNSNLISGNVIENLGEFGISFHANVNAEAVSGNIIVGNKLLSMNGGIDILNGYDNSIVDNVLEEAGPISLSNNNPRTSTSRNTIAYNRVTRLTGDWWGVDGIYICADKGAASENTIISNEINDLTAIAGFWGVGIFVHSLDNGSVNNNTIAHNSINGINGSMLWGAGIAIVRRGLSADKNNIHHNSIRMISGSSPEIYGIWLSGGAKNLVHQNIVDQATVVIPCMNAGISNKVFENSWQ